MKKIFTRMFALSLSICMGLTLVCGNASSTYASDTITEVFTNKNLAHPSIITMDDPVYNGETISYVNPDKFGADHSNSIANAPSPAHYYYSLLASTKNKTNFGDGSKARPIIADWDTLGLAILEDHLSNDTSYQKMFGPYRTAMWDDLLATSFFNNSFNYAGKDEMDKLCTTTSCSYTNGGLYNAQKDVKDYISSKIENEMNNYASDVPGFASQDFSGQDTGPVVTLRHFSITHTTPPITYAGFAVYLYNFRVTPMTLDNTDENTFSSTTKKKTQKVLTSFNASTQNYSDRTSTKTVAWEQGSNYSASNSVSGSTSYSLEHHIEFSTSVEVGFSAFANTSVTASSTVGFTSSEVFQKGWEKGESYSYSGTQTVTDQIEVPARTQAEISTKHLIETATTYYSCPVAVSYDALIVAYTGTKMPSIIASMPASSTKVMGSFTGTGTSNARTSVCGRAYKKQPDPDGEEVNFSRYSYYYSGQANRAIKHLAHFAPMSYSGGLLVESYETIQSYISAYMSLDPLTEIKIPYSERTKTIKVEEGFDATEIDMSAYSDIQEFYGFNSRYGKWKITDKDGNLCTNDAITVDDDGVVTGVKAGTAYITYFIDEIRYPLAGAEGTYSTNDMVKRPTIQITVKPIGYTVNYLANKGTGTKSPVSVKTGNEYKIASNPFTRTGYSFVAWNTKADGSGTTYKAGTTVKNLVATGKSITLYAQWKLEPLAIGKSKTLTNGNTVKVLTFDKKTKKGTVLFTPKKGLKIITVPDTVKVNGYTYKVTKISKSIYLNNKSATKITLGKYVTEINDSNFKNMTALTNVTIGSGVSKIGASAFYGCKNLKTCTIKTTKLTSTKVGSKAFTKTYATIKVLVPSTKLSSYKKILATKGLSSKATVEAY